MEHPPTSRAVSLTRPGLGEELLIVGVAVGLTVAAMLSPMALPVAVSGVVFILAALRFKPLLPAVVFFLPLTPFLDWNFPIRDLTTLVRFSLFAGVVVYRLSHRQRRARMAVERLAYAGGPGLFRGGHRVGGVQCGNAGRATRTHAAGFLCLLLLRDHGLDTDAAGTPGLC